MIISVMSGNYEKVEINEVLRILLKLADHLLKHRVGLKPTGKPWYIL